MEEKQGDRELGGGSAKARTAKVVSGHQSVGGCDRGESPYATFSADEHTRILRHHVQSRGRFISLVAGGPLSRP